MGFLIGLLIWSVVSWALLIFVLVQMGRTQPAAFRAVGRSKPLTMILVFITGIVGVIYYFVCVRKGLAKAASELAPPTPKDDLSGYRTYRKGDDVWANPA